MSISAARTILEGIAKRLEAELGPISRAELGSWPEKEAAGIVQVGLTGRGQLVSALFNARAALKNNTDLEQTAMNCLSLERLALAMDRALGAADRRRGVIVKAAAAAGGINGARANGWKRRAGELQVAIDQLHVANPSISFSRLCILVAKTKGCSAKTVKRYGTAPK